MSRIYAVPWYVSTLLPLLLTGQIQRHPTDAHRFIACPGSKLSDVYPGHYWGLPLGPYCVYSHREAIARLAFSFHVHSWRSWLLAPFFPVLYLTRTCVHFVERGK